jgi:hypothetical protein
MKVDYHDKIIALINDGNIETAKMYVGKVMHENYVYHARKAFKKYIKSVSLSTSVSYYDYVEGDKLLFGDSYSIFRLDSDEIVDEKYIRRINVRKNERPSVENRLEVLNAALDKSLVSVSSINRNNVSDYFDSEERQIQFMECYKQYLYYLKMFLGENIEYYVGTNGAYFIAKSDMGEALVLNRKKSV